MDIKKRFSKLLAAALTVVMVLTLIPGGLIMPQTVRAATYTVTSTADTNNTNTGTLRWAIAQVSGGDIINIDPALAGETITLTSDLPMIRRNVTINGNGITISGDDKWSIFAIDGADVTINRITFVNGYGAESGALYNNRGNLNNTGNLTVIDCVFKDNYATNGSAVFSVHTGTTTTATFVNCLFTGNRAWTGGALYFAGGDGDGTSFINCTFTDDNAAGESGNILYYRKSDTGTAPRFFNCIIANAPSGNIFAGSGVTIDDVVFKNTLTNVTSLGNHADSADNIMGEVSLGLNADGTLKADSPAINAGDNSFNSSLTDLAGNPRVMGEVIDIGAYEYYDITPPAVVSVTPSGTGAAISGNVSITFDEMMATAARTVALNGITLTGIGEWSAGNTVYTIPYSGLAYSTEYTVNISGFMDMAGNVMAAVTSGHTFTTEAAPDLTPPKVLSVTPSGTGAAIIGNVVITFDEPMSTTIGAIRLNDLLPVLPTGSWSAGNTVYTASYSGLAFGTVYTVNILNFRDAAGNSMPTDSDNSFTTTEGIYTVNSIADTTGTGTLQWAVNQVNTGGGGIINIDPALEGQTITLTSALPQINMPVTINGSGITISGNNAYRIFDIDRVRVTMNRIVFANGYSDRNGGAVLSLHDGTNTTITFVNCLFKGNTAVNGGAVYYDDGHGSGATFINCTFTDDNTAANNGNIFGYQYDNYGSAPQFLNCVIDNAANGKDFIYLYSAGSTINNVIFKNTLTNAASLGSNAANANNKVGITPLGLNSDGTLAADSPAINAGDGSLFPNANTSTDLAGNPRILSDSIDIGAYEYNDTTAPTVVSVAPDGTDAAISGNVIITFNEPMSTAAGTAALNATTLTGSGTWSEGNTVFTIPYSNLEYSTVYTVNISGFRDAAGNTMTAVTSGYTFTTTSPPPLTPLAQVTGAALSETGQAAWNNLTNETGLANYSVQLYKNGTALGSPKTSTAGTGTAGVSFLSEMRTEGIGSYTVTVTAAGNGITHTDGAASTASPARGVEKLPAPASPEWSGTNAVWTASSPDTNVSVYRVTVTGGGMGGDTASSTQNSLEVTSPAAGDTFTVTAIAAVTGLFLNSDPTAQSAAYVPPTIPDTTPPIPGGSGTITVTNVTHNSLTLNWAAATDNETAAINLQYYVYRHTSAFTYDPDNVPAVGTLLNTSGTANITTFPVTGLSPSATYHFTVIAEDEAGNKMHYTEVSQTTNALINAAAPVITTQPSDGSVTIGTAHSLIVAAASPDSGTLSYQWYSNTTAVNNGGVSIGGETGAVYASSTTSLGTYYYYVVVTNTIADNGDGGTKTALTTSNAVTLTVNAPQPKLVTSIIVTGAGSATSITSIGDTLQMTAEILPADADDDSVTWSVIPGTGSAAISANGLLTALTNGTVTIRAAANDGSDVYGETTITISGQTAAGPTANPVTVHGSYTENTGQGSYAPNTTVTINAGTRSGYSFDGWTVNSGSITLVSASSASTTFTMPNTAVTVTANWTYIYTGSGSSGGGYTPPPTAPPIAAPPTAAPPKPAAPPPASPPESAAPPTDEDTGFDNPFADVMEGDWFYDAVMFAYSRGLMIGTSTDPILFSPNTSTSRGMIVTVLYRMAGSPSVSGLANPFGDAAEGAWYTDAVVWAAANGIVNGTGGGRYGPNDNITRQDLAVILARYADYTAVTLPVRREYPGFTDEADMSDYAAEAVERLYRAGVISGRPGNVFDPKGNAARAEFAAMLQRFLESAGNN